MAGPDPSNDPAYGDSNLGAGTGAGGWVPFGSIPTSAKMRGQRGQAQTKAALANSEADVDLGDFGAYPPILRYPMDVGVAPDQGHWIIFDIFQQDSAQLKAQKITKSVKSKAAAAQAAAAVGGSDDFFDAVGAGIEKVATVKQTGANSIQVKRESTRRLDSTIALYMPPSVSVTYGAKYADQDIARSVETGVSAFEAFTSTAGFGEALGAAGATAGLGLAGTGVQTLFDKLTPAGAKAMAEISMGAIISPRMELMFEGIQRRTFSFNFTFIPKSEPEAEKVEQIVKLFKKHMSSNYGSNGMGGVDGVREMEIPDFFNIEYMYRGGRNTHLNRIKQCVLTKADIDYGADRWHAFENGQPQTTKLALSFSELEIITKDYIEQGY